MGDCPFERILPRTPYLVLPKMAIQAMPPQWRRRLARLLDEAEQAGLETPVYVVLRDGECAVTDERSGYVRIVAKPADPWADYRHATLADVRRLSPKFRPGRPTP